jgi:hypothetical protein
LATELARELVRYAFEELGFEVLGASFDPVQPRVDACGSEGRIGFQFPGTAPG